MRENLSQIYQTLYYSSIVKQFDFDFQNSDKGTVHSYIDFYDKILSDYREKSVRLLEIGIQGGISILMWKKYFESGEITGVDIDFKTLQPKVIRESQTNSKIKLINTDATLPSLLSKLSGKYDIIIDDGSHNFSHQLGTFSILEDSLNTGGIYIIEDLQSYEEAEWLKKLIPNSEIVDLRNVKGRYDDLLIVYKKP